MNWKDCVPRASPHSEFFLFRVPTDQKLSFSCLSLQHSHKQEIALLFLLWVGTTQKQVPTPGEEGRHSSHKKTAVVSMCHSIPSLSEPRATPTEQVSLKAELTSATMGPRLGLGKCYCLCGQKFSSSKLYDHNMCGANLMCFTMYTQKVLHV